jgi:hypothetical protein
MLSYQHQHFECIRSNIEGKLHKFLSLLREKIRIEVLLRYHDSFKNRKIKCGTVNMDSMLSQRSASKSVTFGFVEIREYGRILTEHPKCQDGLAIGIDWKHAKKSTFASIDVFEKMKFKNVDHGKKPVKKLSTQEKVDLLINIGGYPTDFLRHSFYKCFLESN